MSSDRSRRTDELRDGYKEIVAQQGRVILDRDINALQGLTGERIARDALDFVGPCGTPDDGFAISVPLASPPNPPLWTPPDFADPHIDDPLDFQIAAGTMFVGGERAFLPERQFDRAISYSYFDQPDWIHPPESALASLGIGNPSEPGVELVYLELTEQEVGAVEDPELLDVALGGPDTAQRVKLMRRVKRELVSARGCSDAWQEITALWLQRDGLRFNPDTMRLEPALRLKVSFTQAVAAQDPCDPIATGGYLGADNQLIRVQIAGTPGQPQLLWSYDNASFLYRVTNVSTDGTTLTLAKDPPDSFHIPQTGQLVEVLQSGAILGKEPDESDPTGKASILRVVAEARGELRRLVQPYGPVSGGDPTKFIVLDQPLPSAFITDPAPVFLRVWQAELPLAATGGSIPLDDPSSGASTGVAVTISSPNGEPPTIGAFWQLAFRLSTPQGVYPERLLVEAQPPDGPRRWVCPLAVIDWANDRGVRVTDCRQQFESLVALNRRRAGCCTIAVSPTDLIGGTTLQSVLDKASGLARPVAVCLGAGTYPLADSLHLTRAHSGITIEGCPRGVTLQGAANLAPGAFANGLIFLDEVGDITLRGLNFQPNAEAVARLLAFPRQTSLVNDLKVWLGEDNAGVVVSDLVAMIGVHSVNSQNISLDHCDFLFVPPSVPTDIFGAGVLLHGDCSGFAVRGCSFDSDIPPALTPLLQERVQNQTAPAAAASSRVPTRKRAVRKSAAPEPTPAALQADGAASTLAVRVKTVLSQAPLRFGSSTAAGADRQPPLVATVGCLAATYKTNDQESVSCVLGDAVFCDNRFNDLTWAVHCECDASTIRVADNTVARCGGGVTVGLKESLIPLSNTHFPKLVPFDFQGFVGFQEWGVFAFLPLYYPSASPKGSFSQGPFSLLITNNQIEVMLPAGISEAQSAPALVVLANRPPTKDQGATTSLIITNNQLRNANPKAVTALVVVPDDGRALRSVITSNLISNEAVGDLPRCLDIIPNTENVARLSVAGNSLLGHTNLFDLIRQNASQIPPDLPSDLTQFLSTWVYWNMVQ